MKPTEEQLEALRIYAKHTNTEDKYVWLRKDEKDTYIEYAFKEGAPHDNRCIDWYHSLQPEAIKRNSLAFGHTIEYAEEEIEETRKSIDKKIDHLFRLYSFTCGHEENLEKELERNKESWEKYHKDEGPFDPAYHTCRVGCPSPKCMESKICSHWTYEEPVKCACWSLGMVEEKDIPKTAPVSIEEIITLKEHIDLVSTWFDHIAQIADDRKTLTGEVMDMEHALAEIKRLALDSSHFVNKYMKGEK